jgi:hypothetical protein
VRGRVTDNGRANAPFVGQHLPTGPR